MIGLLIGYITAFLTPILNAGSALFGKKLLNKEHTTTYVASLAVVNFLVSLPMFFFVDYSVIQLKYLLILFAACSMGITAFFLVSASVRHSEVSLIAPLLVLGPGITSITSMLILKEYLSVIQWIGIFVLIIGAYILESHKHDKVFDPFIKMFKSKYSIFVMIALVLYSFTAVFDKILITSGSFSFISYIAFVHLFNAIIMTLYINFKFSVKDIYNSIKEDGAFLFLVSMFTVGYRFTSVVAVKYLLVGVVSAIKRLSSLIIVIVGGELFHEKNLFRKTIACVIMVGGVILLVI